jgi:hypothetical protein
MIMSPLKPWTRANVPINDLTPHEIHVCSDLPNLSRIGFFSCDNCDQWRARDVFGRRNFKSRSEMESFCCTWLAKGFGPIKVYIICGDDGSKHEAIESAKENMPHQPKHRGPKRKALRPLPLSAIPTPVSSNDIIVKSERASFYEEWLRLETLVSKLSDALKKKDQEARVLRKKVQPFPLSSGQDGMPECCKKGKD